jgi:FtsH-binding integral membrane protein
VSIALLGTLLWLMSAISGKSWASEEVMRDEHKKRFTQNVNWYLSLTLVITSRLMIC